MDSENKSGLRMESFVNHRRQEHVPVAMCVQYIRMIAPQLTCSSQNEKKLRASEFIRPLICASLVDEDLNVDSQPLQLVREKIRETRNTTNPRRSIWRNH